MRSTAVWLVAGVGVVALSTTGLAARELKPAARAAFERYVELTEARIAGELEGRAPFLWIDQQTPRNQSRLLAALRRGEVVSERLETLDGGRRITADGAIVHHWLGTVFLPDVQLDQAERFVQNYAGYPTHFSPLIQRAEVVSREGDAFSVAMRTSMKKVITVVVDARYVIQYGRVGAGRLYSSSEARDVFMVDDAGTPGERRTPTDSTAGFLWRLNTYCRFEQKDDGTFEQCESVSLTRDVPFMLRWLVNPFVTGIPRETLAFTLGQVRQALIRP